MRILKVPRQLGPIANASIFVACFPLQPYPPCLSNLGEELVYLDEKKAGWKDDCLFIFGTLQKKKKKNVRLDEPTTNRFTTISSLSKGWLWYKQRRKRRWPIILILSPLFSSHFPFFEGKNKFVTKWWRIKIEYIFRIWFISTRFQF